MERSDNQTTVKESFQITLWQGGGFSGLTTGFTLSSDGDVTHWQRFPGQSNTTLWIAKGNVSEIHTLKNQLEKSGAIDKHFNQTGNMTTGIKYEKEGEQHLWTWNQSNEKEEIPEPLQDWYENTINFCQSIAQNK